MPDSTDSPVRAFARFAVVATPLAALVFLLASGFFSSWDGRAVGIRPSGQDTEPTTHRVVIVDDAGHTVQDTWPADVVRGLALPVNTLGVPPVDVDESAPRTTKRPFSLHFVLTRPGGEVQVVPTTSPRSLAIGLLFWLVALGLHNMYRSGSPLSVTRRDDSVLPEALPSAGVVAQPRQQATRGRKGPPPRSRNKRRRRR